MHEPDDTLVRFVFDGFLGLTGHQLRRHLYGRRKGPGRQMMSPLLLLDYATGVHAQDRSRPEARSRDSPRLVTWFMGLTWQKHSTTTTRFMPRCATGPLVRAGWSNKPPRTAAATRQQPTGRSDQSLEVIEIIESPIIDGRCVLGGPCRTEVRVSPTARGQKARIALLERLKATSVSTVHEENNNKTRRKRK